MSETRALVERLDGEFARLRVGPDQAEVRWPRACLPDGLREGDFLVVSVSLDLLTTEQARRRLAGLITTLSAEDQPKKK